MQADLELSSTPNLFLHEDEEKEFAEIAAKLSEDFDFKLDLFGLNADQESEDFEKEEKDDVDRDEKEVSDEEFSFVINGSDSTSVSGGGDAQIRPYFPLFNQDLLLAHEDYKISENRLPSRPPVEKVFIQTSPSTSSEKTEGGIATGPYCSWEKTSPELSKKSNSTGFSKLWRFKEYLNRSHSDGRDAFVFLNNSETKKEVKTVQKKTAGEVNGKSAGDKKTVTKAKKTTPSSSLEVYLRSKGIYPEHDKRRSSLPYKPGFFTSVNGGLSKNVHPY